MEGSGRHGERAIGLNVEHSETDDAAQAAQMTAEELLALCCRTSLIAGSPRLIDKRQ